ncbi:hypothetical protein HYU19_02295 [Candidatus Woesearchaeota archaeon]|nr:hypothetical protein [Candidatus Woesearchaeota archaeon]
MIWEFSHQILYVDLSGIEKYAHLVIASFMDVIIILSLFMIVSLKNKNAVWIKKPCLFDYVLISLFGIIAAVLIEKINLTLGRWEYATIMPTILGIGISPLVQLSLTGIVSLAILHHFEKEE